MTLPPPPPRPTAKFTTALLSAFRLPSSPPPPDLFLLFAAALSFLFLLKPPSFPSPPPRCRLRLRLNPSFPMNHHRSPPPLSLSFSSPESLSDFLKPRLPSDSLASWGVTPGTKTLHNLWLELSQGETSLLDPEETTPPLRAVHVATVRVRNPRGALLVESHQLLSDGSIRDRLRPLSEKMRPGESVEEAAIRAVKEELGGEMRASILSGSYEMRVEERASASYPGLPARYVLHSVEAKVEGLPEEGEFSTEEKGEEVEAEHEENKAIFVRRHFWKWIDDYDAAGSSHP